MSIFYLIDNTASFPAPAPPLFVTERSVALPIFLAGLIGTTGRLVAVTAVGLCGLAADRTEAELSVILLK